MKSEVVIFWFRRDLRLEDNHGLYQALESGINVLPIFIFDEEILDHLEDTDPRLSFIHDQLKSINQKLKTKGSSLKWYKGKPIEIWAEIVKEFTVKGVYCNEDYEPYAIKRDQTIKTYLEQQSIKINMFKDQVIFAKNEITKADGSPYTVYTPYKNKWRQTFNQNSIAPYPSQSIGQFYPCNFPFASLEQIGFKKSIINVSDYSLENLDEYEAIRNNPAKDKTSHLSPHLRFGTISIRQAVNKAKDHEAFLNELIWREFFMQILFHFPFVVTNNFKKKYDGIEWRNNQKEFEKWKNGQTGYPMVDAGMRQLNATGYMHNRVRMVVAGFLCKHLLIDWRWGEAYFAQKLLDYELSANNGNWQWAAGTGCDAAPYFRVFNPSEQVKKFDPKLEYIRKWVDEIDSFDYPKAMVDHKTARLRAIETYKKGLNQVNDI